MNNQTGKGSGHKTNAWFIAALVIAFATALNVSSCTWDKTSPDFSNMTNYVCFETEVLPIIQSNCAKPGCHDAITQEHGYDFSTYEGIMKAVKPGKPNSSKLYESINGSGEDAMPPAGNTPLTAEQTSTIKLWIEQGALNGPCNSIACDTSNVTYSGSVAPIIQNNCLGCHSNASTGGGILLTNHSLVAEQAQNGNLLGSITHEPGLVPMPYNASQLDDCKIKTIEIWINDGSPNN